MLLKVPNCEHSLSTGNITGLCRRLQCSSCIIFFLKSYKLRATVFMVLTFSWWEMVNEKVFITNLCLCCRFTSIAAPTCPAWLSSSLSPSSHWIWAAQGQAWTSCVRNGHSTSCRQKITYRVFVWIQEAIHPRAAEDNVTLMFWLNCRHCYFTSIHQQSIYSYKSLLLNGLTDVSLSFLYY